MFEFDFLPTWYREARQRRRWLLLQGWTSGALAIAMAAALLIVHHNAATARAALSSVEAQLSEAKMLLPEVDRLTDRRRQWVAQEQLLAKLGLRVEAARLIRTLDAAMPAEVSLIGIQLESEQSSTPSGSPAVALSRLDRRLRVKVQGISPTGAGLAHFVERLSAVPFFEQVAITAARDVTENGRVLRSFEVTFSLNLNSPMGS